MWRLDPTLSPVGSIPPVDNDRAASQRTLEQAASHKRKRSAGGSEGIECAPEGDC